MLTQALYSKNYQYYVTLALQTRRRKKLRDAYAARRKKPIFKNKGEPTYVN